MRSSSRLLSTFWFASLPKNNLRLAHSFLFAPAVTQVSPLPNVPSSTSSYSSTTSSRLNMSDEVAKAQGAAPADDEPTVFDKLLSGEWKSDVVYEDDKAFCFKDVNPVSPVHILVIPKERDGLTQLCKARDDQQSLLGHLLYVAAQVGKKHCPEGYRIVINDGKDGAQSVYHLHLHVVGGRQMAWPPG